MSSSRTELQTMEQMATDSDAAPPSPPVVNSLYPPVASLRPPPPTISNNSRRSCAPIYILPIASIAFFAVAAAFFYFFVRQLANSPIVNMPIGLVVFLAITSLVCGCACCVSFVYYTMKKTTRRCGGTIKHPNTNVNQAPMIQQQQQHRRRQYGDAAATSMRHLYRHPIYHHAAHIRQPADAATHPNAIPPAEADVTAQPID